MSAARLMRPVYIAALAVLAIAVFLAWMHPAVLWPRNVGWLLDGNDRGQSAVGLAAYMRAGRWPTLHQPLLDAPQGLGLLFTDSIPLLGLMLWPFASLIGSDIQLIGLWYLACVLLQVAFAWALVRPVARDGVAAWLGTALLAGMPVLFNRYAHASLCAQWLILWALWIHVAPRRAMRPAWWMAVLGVTALVHAYLLVMVGSIWASSVLRAVVQDRDRRRVLFGVMPVVAVVAAILALHGVIGGHFVSSGLYGQYPMAIDAWWNPANPDYTALLPSTPERPGHGFEGFQYLGAGLLVLVVVAAASIVVDRSGERRQLLIAPAWLLPAFVVLGIVAIGPAPVWHGARLFRIALPHGVIDLLDPVRSGGRLAWPATYALAYAAIAIVARGGRSTLLLGAALALQIVDLTPMLAAVRAQSAGADDPRVYHRTPDPRWAMLVARASAVEFQPAEPYADLTLMEEIAWRAVQACRPVRYFYAARDERTTRLRVAADAAAFRAGRIDPTRLYVLLDGRVPRSIAAQVRRLDGVAIIPPAVAPRASPAGQLSRTVPPPGQTCVTSSSSPRSAS